jgi:DNA polymerase
MQDFKTIFKHSANEREMNLRSQFMAGEIDSHTFLDEVTFLIRNTNELTKQMQKELKLEERKIAELNKKIKACTEKPVLGQGSVYTKIIFIGEAGGANEEKTGLPFQGRAGKQLDKGLYHAGISRNEVYITNLVKFRPPDNRNPNQKEIDKYGFYLYKEIDIIQPKIIVPMGSFASKFILDTNKAIGETRNKLHHIFINDKDYYVFPMYHPAAVLYNTKLRIPFMEDFEFLSSMM